MWSLFYAHNLVRSPPSSTTCWVHRLPGHLSVCSRHHQYSSLGSPFQAKNRNALCGQSLPLLHLGLKILQEDQRTSAPRAISVSIKTAVSIVMCNEPVIFTPARGLGFTIFFARAINPGISFSQMVIFLRPQSAKDKFAIFVVSKCHVLSFFGMSPVIFLRSRFFAHNEKTLDCVERDQSTSLFITTYTYSDF